jgi:hypothetical protein
VARPLCIQAAWRTTGRRTLVRYPVAVLMNESRPSPLSYESAQDFKRRRRWLILTEAHREGIRFARWMFGLLVVGLAVWILASLFR